MNVKPTTHPTAEVLAAYGLGKLDETGTSAVAQHLESCPECLQAVEKVSPDSFVGRVRAARPTPSGTLLPAATAGGSPSRAALASTSPYLPPNEPAPELPPELANHPKFRIFKELGRGGMGIVYKAEHRLMEKTVALKVISQAVLTHPEALERFHREVRAAAKLDHPHIVRALDADSAGALHLLVMEFVEGESLAQVLERKRTLPVAHACHYVRQAALGLQHAHEQGMVHRDIKPQNLMLTPRGQVKILDFGLARLASEQQQGRGGLTRIGDFMGTPQYISPEQAMDASQADIRADIYSLGCTLYFLLAGRPPFQEDTPVKLVLAHIEKEATPLHQVRPDVPSELSAVVARMLAKDPAQRFQKPIEVAQTLAPFCKAGPKPAAPPPLPAPPGSQPVALPDAGRLSPGKPAASVVLVSPFADIASSPAPGDQTVEKTAPLERKTGKGKGGGTARKEAARAQPGGAAKKRLPLAWLVGCGVLGLGVLAAAIVLFWPTPYGTVRIESNDPSSEIVFDKAGPTVKGADMEPINLWAGEHGLLIKRGDFAFEADRFVLKKGATITLKLEWLPGKVQVVQDGKVIASREIPLPPTFKNKLGMEFVLVPKGKSWLGGGAGKMGDKEVEIPYDFYLGKYEVTQEEWEKVMENKPSFFSRTAFGKDAVKDIPDADLKRFPVEVVSWEDAQRFLELVNDKEKESGWTYRLPKEVEWEYACRGGPLSSKSQSAFDFYLDKPTNQLQADQANFNQVLKRTCKVGSYRPNSLGLYDMHGNVAEWCDDLLDPKDPARGSRRVYRGGCWRDFGEFCRAAFRLGAGPGDLSYGLGLRLARVPVGKEPVAPPPSLEKKAEASPATFKNKLGMEFVLVPKGKSWLGGGGGKPGGKEVEIPCDFYLGKYEVTQEEWEKVTGLNPSDFKAVPGVGKEDQKRFPVEQVSWDDAQSFLGLVNDKEKEVGWTYRLPKEVEWEYACRGGPLANRSQSAFDFYLDKPANELQPEQANFKGVLKRTCEVGSYRPNSLGLYDMHGNVFEWCDDLYDPKDPARGSWRVFRGGSWHNDAGHCWAVGRHVGEPGGRNSSTGLRLARVPSAR